MNSDKLGGRGARNFEWINVKSAMQNPSDISFKKDKNKYVWKLFKNKNK